MTSALPDHTPRTNWDQYGLADIWDMVKDDAGARMSRHIHAWAVMSELCDGQATRLRAAAAELSKRWPPERSPAAAVFATQLEEMARIFTEAAAAAEHNGTAVQSLAAALAETRRRVRSLCEVWRRREEEEATRVAVARGTLHDVIPVVAQLSDREVLAASFVDPAKTLVDLAGAPHVVLDWRSALDQQAREVMQASDHDLTETRAHMRRAPVMGGSQEYGHDSVGWPGGTPAYGLGSGGTPSVDLLPLVFQPPQPMPGRSPSDADSSDESLFVGSAANETPVLSGGVATLPWAAWQPRQAPCSYPVASLVYRHPDQPYRHRPRPVGCRWRRTTRWPVRPASAPHRRPRSCPLQQDPLQQDEAWAEQAQRAPQ